MSSYSETQLLELIRSIPYFASYPLKPLLTRFSLLPSHTNTTYKISFLGNTTDEYLLKISKKTTNSFVNRINEQHNSKVAFELGLSSEPLWFSVDSQQQNISLSRYIKNCRNLNPEDLHDTKIITPLAESLHQLQCSKLTFKGDFNDPQIISKQIKSYYKQCSPLKQKELSENISKSTQILLKLGSIKSHKNKAVAAHIDLMTDNILLQDSRPEKLWLIDWEYSAMASPYWDIASLCNASKLNSQETVQLVTQVLGHCDDEDIDLLEKYQFIEKTLVDSWCAAFIADTKKP